MTPEPLRLNPDGTLPGMKEMARKLRAKAGLPPDPAPYGADLPRERPGADGTLGGYPRDAKWRELRAALDGANAEVLALRAERDALLADLAGVLGREATLTVQCEQTEAERDALREVVEAVRARCAVWPSKHLTSERSTGRDNMARDVLALLPAPTEPSNLYPPARGAVAPTTTPQAPGGSGANTGEAGRG